MATGLLVVAAAGAVAGGVATQSQAETARRTETRQRGILAQEQTRQKKQKTLIAAREAETSKRVGARLRATAGRRSGRRSLITGAETGVQSQLGQKQQLG